MSDRLEIDSLNPSLPESEEQDELRLLNRTPHPYHHQRPELLYSLDGHSLQNGAVRRRAHENGNGQQTPEPVTPRTSYPKDSSPPSESGTEADDEHFLKGLPAPRTKLHKGLRGRNEVLSGSPSPLPSPAIWQEDATLPSKKLEAAREEAEKRRQQRLSRRNKNLGQRAAELATVAALNAMVRTNAKVAPLLHFYKKDWYLFGLLYLSLLVLYPLRVAVAEYRQKKPSRTVPLRIPTDFDPAPLLWPPAITAWASLLVAPENPAVILPNIILCICSFPQQLVPKFDIYSPYDSVHWALSVLPLVWDQMYSQEAGRVAALDFISIESMTLLYPLQRILCSVLHDLTTTSLLTAELQLFSIALVNLLVLTSSPQMHILRTLLWGGGLSLLVFCSSVIHSSIVLAKVPKWRFRRDPNSRGRSVAKALSRLLTWRRFKHEVFGGPAVALSSESSSSSDEDMHQDISRFGAPKRVQTLGPGAADPLHAENYHKGSIDAQDFGFDRIARRHTLSYLEGPVREHQTHTPSGRRKRATSMSVKPFLKLTYTQAMIKKWLYAGYVYLVIVGVIAFALRPHIQRFALHGDEPFGWALGYFFGDLPSFRFQVVNANLERWICLPSRSEDTTLEAFDLGWAQHIRHSDYGEANTRLILSAYWVGVIILGLITVFRLKDIYEVDTRRKVFHFTMVGMLLPATFVDPTFVSLALIIVLIVFLALDMFRASQLPPLSKPIASFLAPYVDGRDFRGPVVISHIFLLIGCAIPLWLALASVPRDGTGHLSGWEVPTREVSMVSGVVCVGLGDAAASLIGRRYGRRKWFWGGGKSIEGSVAFAVAVFAGLSAASLWLRIGGWRATETQAGLLRSAANVGVCSSIASLTEAVLTGGNDNVIVPVVLWTCVKSLAI